MPAYRDIIAGLTIGAALTGGAVCLSVATSATAANAAVAQVGFGADGFIDGTFVDGRFARNQLRREFVRALFADGGNRNNDNSINVFDSFNRQTSLQRLRQENEEQDSPFIVQI